MTDDAKNTTTTTTTNPKDLHVFHDSKIEEELDHQHEEQVSQGCGVCGGCGGFCGWVDRNRILSILIFASIGAAVGVGLSYWEPEDPNSKDVAIQWLGLVGECGLDVCSCVCMWLCLCLPGSFFPSSHIILGSAILVLCLSSTVKVTCSSGPSNASSCPLSSSTSSSLSST